MNARLYDPVLGRMLSPDNFTHGGTQGYNRYTYANNNPFKYTDPDGNIWHIVIGAIVGGVVNLGVKAYQGKIDNGWDALAAFGIGAVGGAVTAATGGAAATAFGLGSTGIASGLVTGGVGALAGSPITGIGNSLYFHDPTYTLEQYGKDILMGAVLGGAISGGVAAWKGQNLWWGNTVRPNIPSLPNLKSASGDVIEDIHQSYSSEPTIINNSNQSLFQNSIPETAFSTQGTQNFILTSSRSLRFIPNYASITKSLSFNSFNAFKRAYGAAGKGKAWHHIVEQYDANSTRFGNNAIQNVDNLILLDDTAGSIHRQITGYYNSIQPHTQGLTVRAWLSTQTFEQQYQHGLEIMKRFGW